MTARQVKNATTLVELDDELVGYACGGVLGVLCILDVLDDDRSLPLGDPAAASASALAAR